MVAFGAFLRQYTYIYIQTSIYTYNMDVYYIGCMKFILTRLEDSPTIKNPLATQSYLKNITDVLGIYIEYTLC